MVGIELKVKELGRCDKPRQRSQPKGRHNGVRGAEVPKRQHNGARDAKVLVGYGGGCCRLLPKIKQIVQSFSSVSPHSGNGQLQGRGGQFVLVSGSLLLLMSCYTARSNGTIETPKTDNLAFPHSNLSLQCLLTPRRSEVSCAALSRAANYRRHAPCVLSAHANEIHNEIINNII
jgi:hypothetical protein